MRVSLIFLLFFLTGRIYSQEYWQQNVDYRIEVSLDDSTNFLNGFDVICWIESKLKKEDFKEVYFRNNGIGG